MIPIVGRWTAETPGTISLGQGVVSYEPPPQAIGRGRFDKAVDHVRLSYTEWDAQCTGFSTDNADFNALLARSVQDLRLLSQREGDDAWALVADDGASTARRVAEPRDALEARPALCALRLATK